MLQSRNWETQTRTWQLLPKSFTEAKSAARWENKRSFTPAAVEQQCSQTPRFHSTDQPLVPPPVNREPGHVVSSAFPPWFSRLSEMGYWHKQTSELPAWVCIYVAFCNASKNFEAFNPDKCRVQVYHIKSSLLDTNMLGSPGNIIYRL